MKRRSFITLALACLGIKFVPKAKAWQEIFDTSYHEWPTEGPATWTMLDPEFVSLELCGPPIYLSDIETDIQEIQDLRMSDAGEYARQALVQKLWEDTKRAGVDI